MIKPPSNQTTYDAFYSQDPAIIPLPNQATDEQRKERAEKIKRALELGQWNEVVLPGEAPTVFTFRQLPPEVAGELLGMFEDARNHREMFLVWSLAFRAAVVKVKNLPDAGEIEAAIHPTMGTIATTAFLVRAGISGEVGSSLIVELGAHVLKRCRAPDPKS